MGLLHRLTRYSQKTLGFLSSRKPTFANKFVFSVAALLAILVLPLAVQAIQGSDEPKDTFSPQSDVTNDSGSGSAQGGNSSSESNVDTSVDVSNDANDEGEVNGSNVEVTIDGQEVTVPPSGHIHKKKSSNSTESIVDITVEGNSTGSSQTDININNQHYSSDDAGDDGLGGRLDNHR